jgi:hypothetical protein
MDDLKLDMPAWYLTATGRIRGYWRRELALMLGAAGIGLVLGLVAR